MSILSCLSNRVPVKLSVESPSGKRRRVTVFVERTHTDTDSTLMDKASAAFRAKHGFRDRVVAFYVRGV